MSRARALLVSTAIVTSGLSAFRTSAAAAPASPPSSEARTSAARPDDPRSFGGAPEPRGISSTAMLLVAGLAIGAFVWWRRRGGTLAAPDQQLETLAQTSLGGRARALWIRAGHRHMIVAVTAQSVQTLDRWPERAGDGSNDRTGDRDSAWAVDGSPLASVSSAPPAAEHGSRRLPDRSLERASKHPLDDSATRWIERGLGNLTDRSATNPPAASPRSPARSDRSDPRSSLRPAPAPARRAAAHTTPRAGRAGRTGSRCRHAPRRGRGEEGPL